MGENYTPRGFFMPYDGDKPRKPQTITIQITLTDGSSVVGEVEPRILTGNRADDVNILANAAREIAYTALRNQQIRRAGGNPEDFK